MCTWHNINYLQAQAPKVGPFVCGIHSLVHSREKAHVVKKCRKEAFQFFSTTKSEVLSIKTIEDGGWCFASIKTIEAGVCSCET
jgi:hypothetical protein